MTLSSNIFLPISKERGAGHPGLQFYKHWELWDDEGQKALF